jgi:hypothetical protein
VSFSARRGIREGGGLCAARSPVYDAGTGKERWMVSMPPENIVLLAALAVMIFGLRPPPAFRQRLQAELRRLDLELSHRFPEVRRMPVFSAETIHRKEAEFIRDRLPRKVPYARMGLVLLAGGALIWWLAR